MRVRRKFRGSLTDERLIPHTPDILTYQLCHLNSVLLVWALGLTALESSEDFFSLEGGRGIQGHGKIA